MKKLLLCFVTLTFFSSCEPISNRDMSLAGSISFSHRFITAAGVFDGVSLGPSMDYSHMGIIKISDTEVSLDCSVGWDEMDFYIAIPDIPISGDPDNVTFDFSTSDGTVIHNESEYSSADVSIRGWIKNKRLESDATRYTPVEQEYLCNIEIGCTLNDKKLDIVITSAIPYHP